MDSAHDSQVGGKKEEIFCWRGVGNSTQFVFSGNKKEGERRYEDQERGDPK